MARGRPLKAVFASDFGLISLPLDLPILVYSFPFGQSCFSAIPPGWMLLLLETPRQIKFPILHVALVRYFINLPKPWEQ